MRRTSVNSIDVARAAGVSQSTVSRTFSPDGASRVSADIRARVLAAAAELGYRPNAIARSLITRRSRMVAVLFSYLDNPFYAIALEQLCHALQSKGYHAVVFMLPDTLAEVERTVGELLEYQVDGVVTASVELSSAICARCHAQGVPVVMFNRVQDDPRLSSVSTDNVNGGRLAARHLIATGAKRIGMIGGWQGASTNRDREFGFRGELDAHGVALTAYGEGKFDLAQTEVATRAMFGSGSPRPDAVFVTNDYMAIRALDIMRHELGLNVPGDVAVVGFDDIPAVAQPSYDLTTIRQPIGQMVETTIRILFDRIAEGTKDPEHVILGARLVERGSTRRH
jgi:DNA-binding LacI/PurR family transcriptional regulator